MWCAASAGCARSNPAYLANEGGDTSGASTGNPPAGDTEPKGDVTGGTGSGLSAGSDHGAGDTDRGSDTTAQTGLDEGSDDSEDEASDGDAADRCGPRLAVGGATRVSVDTFVVSADQEQCEVGDACDDLNFGLTSEFGIGDAGTFRSYLLLRFELGPLDLVELWEASISLQLSDEDLDNAMPTELAVFAMEDPDWAPGSGDAETAIKGEATWEHAQIPAQWGDAGDFPATLGAVVGQADIGEPMPGDIVQISFTDPDALLSLLDDGALNVAVTAPGGRLDVLADESETPPRFEFEGCGAR